MSNILEVESLKKSFVLPFSRKKVQAIDGLSFQVKSGGVVGFLGANGAGKTTTLKIILGLIFKDQGSIKLFEKPFDDFSVRRKIGFLTERPYFYDYLTGREFLQFCGRLFKLKQFDKKINNLLDEVGLAHAADRPMRQYSKGMLQRIGIAQALINDPEFLILDEPMSGLDPDGRAEIGRIIKSAQRKGATIFFSTHLLPDVEALCDRVVMIDKGKLVVEEKVATLLDQYASGYELVIRKKNDTQGTPHKVDDITQVQNLIDSCRGRGELIESINPKRPSLEEVFLKLKGGSQ